MDFARGPDCMEGLRHRFMQKCTVESEARLTSDTNFKGVFYMTMDEFPEKDGHMAQQVGEQQRWRNCINGAFNVRRTTGSLKLRKTSTSFCPKLSDSGIRFWEELTIQPDYSVHSPHNRSYQRTSSSVTHLSEELPEEELQSFPMPATQVLPSIGRQYDTNMEPMRLFQRASGNLCAGTELYLPQIRSKTSETPQSFGAFVEALGLVPDPSLLMDVELSESAGFPPNPLLSVLPQPLILESDSDIIMDDETPSRKSKEMPILERAGETLRQKKLHATQV